MYNDIITCPPVIGLTMIAVGVICVIGCLVYESIKNKTPRSVRKNNKWVK